MPQQSNVAKNSEHFVRKVIANIDTEKKEASRRKRRIALTIINFIFGIVAILVGGVALLSLSKTRGILFGAVLVLMGGLLLWNFQVLFDE